MDLIFTNKNHEDMGVLQDFDLDLAFGADENDFECSVPAASHCCEAGSLLYMEGTEYGGIVDTIESDTEAKEVKYKGRTWHGILGSKVIEPLKEGEGSGGSRLPEGYTELTHIESSGTQYIDTGVIGRSGVSVNLTFELTSTSESMLVGSWSSSGRFYVLMVNGTTFQYGYGSLKNISGVVAATGTKYSVKAAMLTGSQTVEVNGVTVVGDSDANSYNTEKTLFLFANHYTDASPAIDFAKAKLQDCQIYENGNLVRDFVPCINPDGAVGLYDLVTKTFFGNSGTGSFGAGVVPRKLPEGYTQVEYIESNGTQYINTGFKPNQDTRVVIDMQGGASTAQSFVGMFVGAGNSSGSTYFMFGKESGSTWRNGAYYHTQAYSGNTNTQAAYLKRRTVDFNGNVVGFGAGEEIHTFDKTTFSIDTPIAIFAVLKGSTIPYYGKILLYSCQIYDNGTLVRDFVPCKNSGGVYGLYDITNDVFYQNAGSGTFTAGDDVEYVEQSTGTEIDVTVKAEDADGNSLVGKYLVISGDANDCIRFILNRIGLSSLLCAFEEAAGIDIQEYQFHRFTDAYSGLTGMLASAGHKLHTEVHGGQVVLSAEAVVDYTADEEFDSDLVDFVAIKKFNAVNHLICLGAGELENRTVIHLYADKDGNISQTQTQDGLDEVVAVYEDTSAEAEELIQKGTEELLKLWEPDKLKVDFDDSTDSYDVGDIVGACDNITGISVAAVITKKIVTIKNGLITISYKVGE